MSKNDMVMVPRDLAQFIVDGGYCWPEAMAKLEAILISSSQQPHGKPAVDYSSMSAAERLAFCRGAEQHQGEPVTLPERKRETLDGGAGYRGLGNSEGWNACLDEIAKLGPLYSRPAQGEPVAEVEIGFNRFNDTGEGLFVKWLLPDGAPLPAGTKLYTHADPAEVERLRAQLATETARAHAAVGDANEAERKLAEAHALLRKIRQSCELSKLRDEQIDVILSASAEPSAPAERMAAIRSEAAELSSKLKHACCQSCMANPCDCAIQSAPVEIDERAAFEAAYDRGELLCMDGPYDNPRKNQAFATWQARAALERKP